MSSARAPLVVPPSGGVFAPPPEGGTTNFLPLLWRSSARARRVLALGLALFALAQAALALAVLHEPRLRDRDYGRKATLLRARLAGSPRPLAVVGLGSSRTVFGLRGASAEPWLTEKLGRRVVLFNMGFPGCGPVGNRLTLERLLNQDLRPDLLLLEVLPAFLTHACARCEVLPDWIAASRLRRDELRLLQRYAPQRRAALERDWWTAQALPVHVQRFRLMQRLAPALLPPSFDPDSLASCDEAGWLDLRRVCKESADVSLATAKKEYAYLMQDYQVAPAQLGAVAETIERARQEGIAVAVVLMPEGPTFHGWYSGGTVRTVERTLAWLREECGVRVIDLRGGWPESAFLDSHHLLADGAERFTRRLAGRIAPLLDDRPLFLPFPPKGGEGSKR